MYIYIYIYIYIVIDRYIGLTRAMFPFIAGCAARRAASTRE